MMRNGGQDARCAHSIRFTDQHAADIWSRRREEHSFTCGSWTEDTFTTGFITSPSHRWRPLPPTLTPSSPITLFSLCCSCVLTCSLFILHPEIILLPHHNSPHICLLPSSLNCVPHEHRSHHWDIFQFFSDAAVLWLIYLLLYLRNLFTFNSWLKMVSMIHGSYLGTGSFKIVQLFSFLPNANRGPEKKTSPLDWAEWTFVLNRFIFQTSLKKDDLLRAGACRLSKRSISPTASGSNEKLGNIFKPVLGAVLQ